MDPEEVLAAPEKPEKPAEAAELRRPAEGPRSTGVIGVTGARALAAGLALGLGGLLLATHPWRSGEGSRTSTPTWTTDSAQVPRSKADPAAPNGATPADLPSINLRTTGPSWVEVRSTDGVRLFSGELNGQRSFPLRSGVMIRSGRTVLVYLRVNGQPERKLGSIDWPDWRTFQPAPTARPGAGR
jgi:hypothetical protein